MLLAIRTSPSWSMIQGPLLSLNIVSQKTILMLATVGSMVKIVKEEQKVCNILAQCSYILASFVFIKLFNFSSGDNFTPLLLSRKSSKTIPQFGGSLPPQPSNLVKSIQSIVSCLHAMALPWHTSNKLHNLDYDKIPLQKVQFLPIGFDGDVLFELPSMFSNSSQVFANARHG